MKRFREYITEIGNIPKTPPKHRLISRKNYDDDFYPNGLYYVCEYKVNVEGTDYLVTTGYNARFKKEEALLDYEIHFNLYNDFDYEQKLTGQGIPLTVYGAVASIGIKSFNDFWTNFKGKLKEDIPHYVTSITLHGKSEKKGDERRLRISRKFFEKALKSMGLEHSGFKSKTSKISADEIMGDYDTYTVSQIYTLKDKKRMDK